MLIGTWDIKNAGSRQHRITVGNHSVSNISEWITGSVIPVAVSNTVGFKTLETVLVVSGDGREEILNNVSTILAHCLDPAELMLDDYSHKFYGILNKYSLEESCQRRWHLLTLEWECYEYGDTVSEEFTKQSSISINNPGNILTPAVIRITPQIGASTLTITGLCHNLVTGEKNNIIISNVTTGNVILLDGETGLLTENGALNTADTVIWELPTLLPGDNTITLSSSNMNVTIQFKPRYM